MDPDAFTVEGYAVLLMLPLELHGHERGDPAFTPLDLTGTELRVSQQLGVDISSRTDINFYTQADDAMVGDFAFPGDPHPDHWWRAAHERGQLAVLVGPVEKFMRATTAAAAMVDFAAAGGRVGLLPLVVWGYSDGIGTAHPDRA